VTHVSHHQICLVGDQIKLHETLNQNYFHHYSIIPKRSLQTIFDYFHNHFMESIRSWIRVKIYQYDIPQPRRTVMRSMWMTRRRGQVKIKVIPCYQVLLPQSHALIKIPQSPLPKKLVLPICKSLTPSPLSCFVLHTSNSRTHEILFLPYEPPPPPLRKHLWNLERIFQTWKVIFINER